MMMDDERVRVGLVGLGGHGRTMQQAAGKARNLHVTAVFDLDENETEAAAERFECAAACSYEDLLAQEDLEAVVLVTPNHVHRPQTEAALEAGKHVLVEKPIANTVEDGRAMVKAARTAGRVLMVGHNMRRTRAARLARRTLEEGRLGEVVSMEIHFSADNTQKLPEETWRLRPEQCPLLPVMQLGIHAIDLVHYLIGPIQDVCARARSVTTRTEVVDSVAATFRTEGGVLGTLVSNYCTQVTFEYRVAGTKGSLRCTPHRFWFRRTKDTDPHGDGPAETQDFTAHELESFRLQMEAFGEAVRVGAPPETDGAVGLQALAVVEALQRSAERQAAASVLFPQPQEG